jgi:hypothetical protein
VCHKNVCPSSEREIQYMLVAGVRKVRTPKPPQRYLTTDQIQGFQIAFHFVVTHLRFIQMLGAIQHVLILQRQRCGKQKLEASIESCFDNET